MKRTALLREEGGRTVSDPAEIDEEIHAFATPRLHPEGGLAHENRGQTHLPELLVMSFLKRLLHSLTVTFVAAVVVLAANKTPRGGRDSRCPPPCGRYTIAVEKRAAAELSDVPDGGFPRSMPVSIM